MSRGGKNQTRRLVGERLEKRDLLTRLFDLDADGDLDAYYKSAWYENLDGHGNFEIRQLEGASEDVSLVVGDVDSDGDSDIVSTDLRWYENTDGEFNTVHILPVGGSSTRIKLTDVGGDGDLDIVSFFGQTVTLFENVDGFATALSLVMDPEYEKVFDAADFDFDGDLDFTVFDERKLDDQPSTNRALLLLSDAGSFREFVISDHDPDGSDFTSVSEFIDIDNDGLLDIASTDIGSGGDAAIVYWHRNVGEGVIDDRNRIEFLHVFDGTEFSYGFRDVDKDGRVDFLFGGTELDFAKYIVWRLNDGTDDPFANTAGYLKIELSASAVSDVGDIDGDLVVDFIERRFELGQPLWTNGLTNQLHEPGETRIQLPASTEFSLSEINVATTTLSNQLVVANLDNNSQVDLIVTRLEEDLARQTISWIEFSKQTNQFETVMDLYTTELNVEAIVAGDIDFDGDQDFVVQLGSSNLVRLQNDPGGFTAIEIDGTSFFKGLKLKDYDNDSDLDLFAVEKIVNQQNIRESNLVALENDTGGFNRIDLPIDLQRNPDFVIGDIDGSGHDVIVVKGRSEEWDWSGQYPRLDVIEWNNGVFSLTSPIAAERCEHPETCFRRDPQRVIEVFDDPFDDLSLADVDSDGKLDIVLRSDSRTQRLTNKGENSFVASDIEFSNDRFFRELTDMDGDGDLDLLSWSLNEIWWVENLDGAGDFQHERLIGKTQNKISDVVFVDFDGDGRSEVLALLQDGRFVLYEQKQEPIVGDSNGDGIFNSRDLIFVFTIAEYEDDIVGNSTFQTGDWNGDGEFTAADLVFAFQSGNYVFAAQRSMIAAAVLD